MSAESPSFVPTVSVDGLLVSSPLSVVSTGSGLALDLFLGLHLALALLDLVPRPLPPLPRGREIGLGV